MTEKAHTPTSDELEDLFRDPWPEKKRPRNYKRFEPSQMTSPIMIAQNALTPPTMIAQNALTPPTPVIPVVNHPMLTWPEPSKLKLKIGIIPVSDYPKYMRRETT